MKCYICGKQFHRPKSQQVSKKSFCSMNCYNKYKKILWSKKKNPRWNGGDIKYKCEECGKIFFRKSHGKRTYTKFCSIKCSAINRGRNNRGENHFMWKGVGGRITKPIRGTGKFQEWRCKILKRDKFRCVKCNRNDNLHVHHKKELAQMVMEYKKQNGKLNVYDDIFYQIDNGITLCRECHRKIHKL